MADKTVYQHTTTLKIARFPNFCELLSERFHTSVEHYCDIDYFTIFISLVDHSGDTVEGKEKVMLVGLDTQETFLNAAYKKKYAREDGLSDFNPSEYAAQWNTLRTHKDLNDTYINSALKKYKNGGNNGKDYTIKRITVHNLHNFLLKEDNAFRKRIYSLMSVYFKPIKDCSYLTLPLIQFGQIDGFLHIIYNGQDTTFYNGEDTTYNHIFSNSVKFLIKTLSIQYESLLLSWAVKGLHLEKTENITNPMLIELGFDNYYEKSKVFHSKRRDLTKEHRKNAVTAIILDSYAHNIGAHSLPTITWWLLKRSELLQKNANFPHDSHLSHFPMIVDKIPFPFEMHNLLRFLNEKGEFWAGMSREETFGGKISTLFSVIWGDFIQNLLVLGTIASSEGVYRLNLHLTIYKSTDKVESEHGFEREKTVDTILQPDGTSLYLNGEFVSIDLKKQRTPLNFEDGTTGMSNKNTEFISSFLTQNPLLFEAFKSKLIQYKVFFPGNTIGKHALFTLIESEIRNIKHYNKTEIEYMRVHGLTLNISIEESFCRKKDPETPVSERMDKALYKIGIWLNHRQKITTNLLEQRLKLLGDDIIDADFYPKFGGSYQDKICAAFLFNNSFISVQDVDDSERHKMYYPWVKMGISRYENDDLDPQKPMFRDYEVSYRRLILFPKSRPFFDTDFNRFMTTDTKENQGYVKKYIHLWKGKEEALHLDAPMIAQIKKGWENPARFRFAMVDNQQDLKDMRAEGIIRVVSVSSLAKENEARSSYVVWLNNWLKEPKKTCRIIFREAFVTEEGEFETGKILGGLIFENQEVNYVNQVNYRGHEDNKHTDIQYVNLVHNTQTDNQPHEHICRYRQHGVLVYHFLRDTKGQGDKFLVDAVIKPDLAAELFEVLASKICIFENRLYNRITDTSPKLLDMLDNQLKVKLCSEDVADWQKIRDSKGGFFKYHFLVIHLSFIEKFKETKMSVSEFIKTEILRGKKAPPNFILVITTGRGRTNWWRDLGTNTNYQHFTTFKTIEDLLEGVENAASQADDFEIKYRLIKSLMGS